MWPVSVSMELFSYTDGGEPDCALSFHASLPLSSSGMPSVPLEVEIPAGSGVEKGKPLHIVILQRTRSTIPFTQIRALSKKPCTHTRTHSHSHNRATQASQ